MLTRRLTVAAAAAAVAGLIAVAGPAVAAGPPYTVTVGTNTTGTYSTAFSRVSGTPLTFTAGLPLNCTNVTANANTAAGANRNPVFVFTALNFSGCSLYGTAVTFTYQSTPTFTGTGNNATTGTETIAGRVANLALTVSAGSICRFTVTGFADASFNETSQRLLINEVPTSATVGNLTISNKVGCGNQVQNGGKVTLVATLAATSAGGSVNLS